MLQSFIFVFRDFCGCSLALTDLEALDDDGVDRQQEKRADTDWPLLNGMAYQDFHDLNISFAIYTFAVAHPIVVVVVQSHRLGIPSAPRCCNAMAAQQ